MHIASCDAQPKQRAGRIGAGLALAYKYGRSVFYAPWTCQIDWGCLHLL